MSIDGISFTVCCSVFYLDHVYFSHDFNKVKGDREVAERFLHSFKGITGTVAAIDVYPLAIKVEKAVRDNDPQFSVLFEKMALMLDQLLKNIKDHPMVEIESTIKE